MWLLSCWLILFFIFSMVWEVKTAAKQQPIKNVNFPKRNSAFKPSIQWILPDRYRVGHLSNASFLGGCPKMVRNNHVNATSLVNINLVS